LASLTRFEGSLVVGCDLGLHVGQLVHVSARLLAELNKDCLRVGQTNVALHHEGLTG
jgi:hypothetical protein